VFCEQYKYRDNFTFTAGD